MHARVREIAATEIAALASGLDDLHAQRIQCIHVREVYSRDAMAKVVSRLASGVRGFARLPMGVEFEAYSMAPGLDRSKHEPYLAAVSGFRSAAAEVFADVGDLDHRFAEVLGALAGTREIRVPEDRGRPYMPFDIRCLPTGGRIPPHIELEQLARPPYRHLRPMLDGVTLLSFFLMLQAPESGGLVLHDISWSDVDASRIHRGHTHFGTLVAQRERQSLAQEAGDLIVFDGGRIAHQVAPVGGPRDRWTVGGFLSRSADDTHWWRWA